MARVPQPLPHLVHPWHSWLLAPLASLQAGVLALGLPCQDLPGLASSPSFRLAFETTTCLDMGLSGF